MPLNKCVYFFPRSIVINKAVRLQASFHSASELVWPKRQPASHVGRRTLTFAWWLLFSLVLRMTPLMRLALKHGYIRCFLFLFFNTNQSSTDKYLGGLSSDFLLKQGPTINQRLTEQNRFVTRKWFSNDGTAMAEAGAHLIWSHVWISLNYIISTLPLCKPWAHLSIPKRTRVFRNKSPIDERLIR